MMENFNNLTTPDNIPNPIPVPNTIPNTAPIPNTTPIEPKIEGDDNPLTLKKKPTRTSDVWDFFTKVLPLNPIDPRCTCNYCGADYACHSQRVGTSSLWVHLGKCKKNPNKVTDKKQKLLSFKPGGDGVGNLLAVTFNKVKCRNALAKYKMGYLKYCFDSVYDAETVAKLVVKVDSILQKMFSSYNLDGDDDSSKLTKSGLPQESGGKETHKRKMLENYLQHKQLFVTEKKNDLERYLAEEPVNPMASSFNILDWWKDNSVKYKNLSKMARDVLAIPVSTVASESAFSTSGRILDSFRSSLSPKMLEALVCTQSWLKEGCAGIKSREHLDEAEYYKFLEEDAGKDKKKSLSNDPSPTINIDE
ncbi:hypothetical protein POM88_019923 [Heracleum sosnowskyi]|uniref:BED-type domain-containing protein n=1 Tax=Heracleum sosnowskyi TaxID=360622 RepID=A0AAD8MSA6_9APIA|nr:hypothetical protein POM88_019923 [Heracleum sosnowskyi]